MILADKIINERKKNGWSQEELADKLNVSRQAVSKWEGAQSIPDLQKIVALADLFGVTTDYLVKDELEAEDKAVSTLNLSEDFGPVRKVSLEEARAYIDIIRKTAPMVALGVSLCIISPVLLILLAGFSDSGIIGISEKAVVGIGLPALLLLVACAVFMFLRVSSQCEEYEYLEKEEFETAYGVEGYVNREKNMYKEKRSLFLSIGVVLCMLSCVPLFLCAVLEQPDYYAIAATCLLLIIVAIGVYMIVRVSCVNSAFNAILQKEDYTPEEKRSNKRLGSFSGIYWCIITAVYLALGFTKNIWDKAWILFAVGGVMYAAVYAIAKAIIQRK